MSSNQQDSNQLSLAGFIILLVEDNETTKELLAEILEMQGAAKISTVTTVEEALELIPQLKPDILISNIILPDQDGCDLIRQVRNLEPAQGGKIPAIAITATVNNEICDHLLEAGFQACFFKPFNIDEFLLKIIELVQSYRVD